MAVTDSLLGRRRRRRLGRRALGVLHLGRRIERAGKRDTVFTARDDAFSSVRRRARGDALHKAGGDGRAAGHLGRARERMTSPRAQCLREVVRGEGQCGAQADRGQDRGTSGGSATGRCASPAARCPSFSPPSTIRSTVCRRLPAGRRYVRAARGFPAGVGRAVADGGLEQLRHSPRARPRDLRQSDCQSVVRGICKRRAVVIERRRPHRFRRS